MAKPKKAPKVSEVTSDERSIFLNLLDKYRDAKDQAHDAGEIIKSCVEAGKAAGFLKDDFEFAILIDDPEREKKAKAKIKRRLFIARLMDKALGDQLELFSEPAPIPEAPAPGIRGFVPFSAEELLDQQTLAEEGSKH